MKLLLDTHIWLWGALDPGRLTRRVHRALTDPGNELCLSPVSVWELELLCRKGRFQIPTEISAWVAQSMKDLELNEIPFTIEVALALQGIDFPHGDPADHFLAATAKVFELTLVTGDERLLKVQGIDVLPNR